MLRMICSLSIITCVLSTALADIPPPPPAKGLKRVPLEHVMKLDKEIPGYKFFTYTGTPGGGEVINEELKLEPGKGVVVPGASSASVWKGVVAVPEKAIEKPMAKKKLANLLSRENRDKLPAGVVLYQTSGTSEDLKQNDPRSKVESVITISADEKAGVKFTAAETPATPGKKSSSEFAPQPPAGMLIGGIAMSLAFVSSGLWWFRRK